MSLQPIGFCEKKSLSLSGEVQWKSTSINNLVYNILQYHTASTLDAFHVPLVHHHEEGQRGVWDFFFCIELQMISYGKQPYEYLNSVGDNRFLS